jgi:hypothetical protein
MASITIRRMLSSSSPSVPLLVSPLPSLWAAPPKPIVATLRHLGDWHFSPTLVPPPKVSRLLTPWTTPPRPYLVKLHFLLIPLLALPVGLPSLSPWVTPPKPKDALYQSAIADRSTSTRSYIGKTCWITWCSHVTGHRGSNHSSTLGFQGLQPWTPQGSSRTSCSKGGVKCHVWPVMAQSMVQTRAARAGH